MKFGTIISIAHLVAAFAGAFASRGALATSRSLETLRVESLKTHSRIVVRVDESVPSEWKNTGKGFELLLKGIGLSELGAPLGEEREWAAKFVALKDPRVASLRFEEAPGGIRIVGQWRFPEGAQALARPVMESFEYRDKGAAQIVVDLWHKKGPTLAEVNAVKRQTAQLEAMHKAEAQAKDRAERRIASEKRKAELADTGRFCRVPLDEESDVFLRFLPFHEAVDYPRWIATTTPDRNFHYYEPKAAEAEGEDGAERPAAGSAGKSNAAQYVRLALELYRQGKFALVLRTLDFFDTEHSRSEYRHEMRFLRANSMIKLGLDREAEEVLSKLMVDAREAPVALHSAMFLAARRAGEKAHLQAIEAFLWLIKNHPEHRLSWLFHLGAAESFAGIRQTDRALKEYQWVMEYAPEKRYSAEAAMRLGDLYLDRFEYAQALAAYSQSLGYFDQEAGAFPSVHLNRAEALYGLGEHKRAGQEFAKFLERYPTHPSGWRASFRLGEIAARESTAADEAARNWYVETINRYPYSSGALLARVRLASCGDHGGLSAEAADKFFTGEAEAFDGKGEVEMLRFPAFRALAYVRSLVTRKGGSQEARAVEVATRELGAARNLEIKPKLLSLLEVLFRKRIVALLDEGKSYEALTFYQEKASILPRESRAVEPDYLLKLSQAASDLGLGKLAGELGTAYRQASAGASTRGLASGETGAEERLRKSEQHFTEAKALWVASAARAGASGKPSAEHEKAIRDHLAQVAEESPFSFEREIILGLLDDRAGRTQPALAHAAKAQLLKPAAGARDLRLESWLAGLEARAGDPKVALEMARNLQKLLGHADKGAAESPLGVLGVPAVSSPSQLLILQATLLETLGKWGEAAATYARVLEGQDKSMGYRGQARYGYARALLRSGERDKAVALLKELSATAPTPSGAPGAEAAQGSPSANSDDHWRRLASETLANISSAGRNPDSTNAAKEGTKQ